MLDGFCAPLISWSCMGKGASIWFTDVLYHMGHHLRCHNLFPCSLLLFQTCQSCSIAEKFKGCDFFPPQKPCAKQAFPSHGGSPRWPKLGNVSLGQGVTLDFCLVLCSKGSRQSFRAFKIQLALITQLK